MRPILYTTLFLFLGTGLLHSHYLWIEAESKGEINREHSVRVHYGEYTYDVIEKVRGEAFPLVAKFRLWVADPSGRIMELEPLAAEDHYVASFTPTLPGTYTVLLNNDEIEVLDYTEYDFGIFKTHYHASTQVQVGKADASTTANNPEGIVMKRLLTDGDTVRLQVIYKGKPLPSHEVQVFLPGLWSKTLETDEQGVVAFSMPWPEKYIVETTFKEEVPGTYRGKDYQFIWHCATFCITDKKI